MLRHMAGISLIVLLSFECFNSLRQQGSELVLFKAIERESKVPFWNYIQLIEYEFQYNIQVDKNYAEQKNIHYLLMTFYML